MNEQDLMNLLESVKSGSIPPAAAAARLGGGAVADLGFARLDLQRKSRCGSPEVVFCPGKKPEQAAAIASRIVAEGMDLLATRASPEHAAAIAKAVPSAAYDPVSRPVTLRVSTANAEGPVTVACAGTADIPVAEEAVVTASMLGARVERYYDVGVAGLHRLLSVLEPLRKASVVVAVAGMEGALASVVGGLVAVPVIGVPTSVGYGTNFGGVSALLAMLNSCASGVTVVNIDNGFGAGYAAAMINRGLRPEA